MNQLRVLNLRNNQLSLLPRNINSMTQLRVLNLAKYPPVPARALWVMCVS